MQITVTGCNNCPFRYYNPELGLLCSYNVNLIKPAIIESGNNITGLYHEHIPFDCPITLNGGTITVTTKSE